MSKVVFVGNVPYNMGEDQLIDVFKSVGQVVGFRLVFDRDTGKPRDSGFYHETALSAVRNLNNTDVGGRPLRIDLADSDPFLEGKTTVRGELIDSGESRSQWRERERDHDYYSGGGSRDPNAFLASLPSGIPVPPGSTAMDMISQTLATMNPNQLMEVLAQTKAFVITHSEQARALLVAHPQLACALFQALVLNKIVDSAILQRMQKPPPGQPVPPPPLPAQPLYPQPPIHTPQPANPPPMMPPHMYQHHPAAPPPAVPPQGYYARPLPPPQAQQQLPPQPDFGLDPAQRAMLTQILSMSPEQINALPPTERDAFQKLRNQFSSVA